MNPVTTWEDLQTSPLRIRRDDIVPGASYRFLCKGPCKTHAKNKDVLHGIVHASNPGIPHSVRFPGHAYQAPRPTSIHKRLGHHEKIEVPASSWVIVAQWQLYGSQGIPMLYLADYFGLGDEEAPANICVTESSFLQIKLTT